MMDDREIAAVVLAHANGAGIQFRLIVDGPGVEWTDCNTPPLWNFSNTNYRVKPRRPREWVISGGAAFEVRGVCALSPEVGIHVREVIE